MNPTSILWQSKSKVLPVSGQTFTERNQRTVTYPTSKGRWIFDPRSWNQLDSVSRVAQFRRFVGSLPPDVTPAHAATLATKFASLYPTSRSLNVVFNRNGMLLAQTAPSGQTVSSTPIGVTTGSEPGNPAPGQNIYGWNDQGQPLDANGNVLLGGGGTTGGGFTPTQTSAINAASSLLGVASTDIMSALQNQNQLQLAQLQSQTQLAIARLQAQQQTPQIQAQLQSMQMMNQMLQQQQGNTSMLIMVGIGAVVLLGGMYLLTQSGRGGGTRRNPVVRHRGRRKFFSMSHLRRMRGLR